MLAQYLKSWYEGTLNLETSLFIYSGKSLFSRATALSAVIKKGCSNSPRNLQPGSPWIMPSFFIEEVKEEKNLASHHPLKRLNWNFYLNGIISTVHTVQCVHLSLLFTTGATVFKLWIQISFYVSFEFVPKRKKIHRPMLGDPTSNGKTKLQRKSMVKKSRWKVPLWFYYNYKFLSIWLCCDGTKFGLSWPGLRITFFGLILCRGSGSDR